MSDPAELMNEILRLDEDIAALELDRKVAMQLWAESVCPYKVGDVVTIRGYSHKGKQGEVTRVFAKPRYRGGCEWSVEVVVLKNDGTKGVLQANWDEHCEKARGTNDQEHDRGAD